MRIKYTSVLFIVFLILITGNNNIIAQITSLDTVYVIDEEYTIENRSRKEAREDIAKGDIIILVRGMFFPSEITDSLSREYGFRFMSDGCVPIEGNNFYNDEVKKYLSKKNGKGWWKRFKEEEAMLKERAKLKEEAKLTE